MFLTLILGILAGFGAPTVEGQLRGPLQNLFSGEIPAVEMRAMSLVLCLFVASILAMILGSSHVLPLVLGALIGVLAPRLYDRFRAMRAPDYDS